MKRLGPNVFSPHSSLLPTHGIYHETHHRNRRKAQCGQIHSLQPLVGQAEAKLENGWYPEVIGLAPGETDKVVGRTARFFMAGVSKRTVTFLRPGEQPQP